MLGVQKQYKDFVGFSNANVALIPRGGGASIGM